MNFISRIILFLALMPVLYGSGGEDFSVQFDAYDDYCSESVTLLKELHQQTQNLFRMRGTPGGRGCRIILTKAVPPEEIVVTAQNDHWKIEFDHTWKGWQKDRRFISRLSGIMVTALFTGDPPPSKDLMPRWIIAGILHRIESKRGAEQVLKRNQDFAVSQALFAGDCRLPDFKELTKLPSSLTDPPGVVRMWTDEFSRLLLDAGAELNSAEQNPLRQYVLAHLRGDANAELLFERFLSPHFLKAALRSPLSERFGLDAWNRMSPPIKVQRYLEYFTFRRVFNNSHPQPVRELHKQFAAFRKINLPVPGAKPGTPPETFDMEKYPELLEDHPHAPATIPRKVRELRSVAEGGDIEFREELQQLGRILREMQKDPDDPSWSSVRRYRRQFPRILHSLRRREQIEQYLEKVEEQFRSPARFYEEAILESMRRPAGETPRVTQMLDKAEKQYIGSE